MINKPLSSGYASKPLTAQYGASLIEVLVAILIFSIGMLGIAALTAAAVRYQTGNVARGAVAAGISDISDRIRGNIYGASGFSPPSAAGTTTVVVSTGYSYTATYSSQQAGTITFPTSPDCSGSNCTFSELSNYDMAAWRKDLRERLPGGAGWISGDIRSGFDVTIMWFDKNYVASEDANFLDTLSPSRVCLAADDPKTAASRFCCPEAALAPDGVRCYSTKVYP